MLSVNIETNKEQIKVLNKCLKIIINFIKMAFNNSPQCPDFVKNLIERFNLKYALETGTHHGNTTKFLASVFEKVFTMELTDQYYQSSKNALEGLTNVTLVQGDTGKDLNVFLDQFPQGIRSLAYLDAHWYDFWPLLDEIKQIGARQDLINNCIIIIDDFMVPHRPDISYDSYKGQPLSIDFVKKTLDDSIPDGYRYEYFVDAIAPHTRGRLVVIPSKMEE